MAGTRKAPLWRQAFLRALRRTGNVRTSAFEAGVDPGTAYDHRAKDAGFRAKWAGVLKAYGAGPSPRPRSRLPDGSRPLKGRGGKEELVLRRGKDGDRLVRASPGRWSRRVEESFLDGLAATGCVTSAAAAAGMSTNAFYKRREKYPEFGARWDERVGRFQAQLPALINAAAVEAMSPEVPGAKRRGRARLPKLSGGEAVRVYAINENAKAKGRGRGGARPPEVSDEEVAAALNAQLDLLDRRLARERRAGGWTDAGNGIWVPPGWTPPSPEAPAGKGGPDDAPPAPASGP